MWKTWTSDAELYLKKLFYIPVFHSMYTIVSIVCSQVSIPEGPEWFGFFASNSFPFSSSQNKLWKGSNSRLASKYLRLEAYRGGKKRVVCIKLGLSTSYTSPGWRTPVTILFPLSLPPHHNFMPFLSKAKLAMDQLEPSCWSCLTPDLAGPTQSFMGIDLELGCPGSSDVFMFWGNFCYPLAEPWAGYPLIEASFVGFLVFYCCVLHYHNFSG